MKRANDDRPRLRVFVFTSEAQAEKVRTDRIIFNSWGGDGVCFVVLEMRYAVHRKDANQQIIVNGLLRVGAKVCVLGGKNIPDLLVGYRQTLTLLELKDGNRKPSERRLRPGQQRFADEWQGYPVFKVESLADAFRCLGIEIQG